MTRRGFALADVLAGTVLTGVLALTIGSLLLRSFARLRDRSERMALEQALRVASAAAQSLLEPLGADSIAGPDLSPDSPQALTARVPRGAGVLCHAELDHVVARAGPGWWQAVRAVVAGRDSLLIGAVAGPRQWMSVPLSGSAAPLACPDGSSGTRLPTALAPDRLASIGNGSPIRVFEPVELRAYASSGATWLGLRLAATGEAIQPLAGPLAGAELSYFDRDGAAPIGPADIAFASIRLRAQSERAGGIGLARSVSAAADSVTISVALRGRP